MVKGMFYTGQRITLSVFMAKNKNIPVNISLATEPRGGGGYSGFQVTGMIEWEQKSRPKKIPTASNKTQKIPWTKN